MPNQQYKTTKGNSTGTRVINKAACDLYTTIDACNTYTTWPWCHCQAGYSFGAVAPWPLQRCSCGFAGDDISPFTDSLACIAAARTVLDLKLCGSCIGCRSHRDYSTSCACLYTRCSSGTLPITLPACWRPPLTFLHSRHCVRRVSK